MVRATLKRGRVHPLEPLPDTWLEGCDLVVTPATAVQPPADDDLEGWLEELDQLGDPFEEPGEWERFQANLTEADRLAKDHVRRQMALS